MPENPVTVGRGNQLNRMAQARETAARAGRLAASRGDTLNANRAATRAANIGAAMQRVAAGGGQSRARATAGIAAGRAGTRQRGITPAGAGARNQNVGRADRIARQAGVSGTGLANRAAVANANQRGVGARRNQGLVAGTLPIGGGGGGGAQTIAGATGMAARYAPSPSRVRRRR